MDGSRSDDATNCGGETKLELLATEGDGEVALPRKGHLKRKMIGTPQSCDRSYRGRSSYIGICASLSLVLVFHMYLNFFECMYTEGGRVSS